MMVGSPDRGHRDFEVGADRPLGMIVLSDLKVESSRSDGGLFLMILGVDGTEYHQKSRTPDGTELERLRICSRLAEARGAG